MAYYRGHYFTPRFTDEQMIEIGRSRERWEAYIDKIHPYRAYSDEPLEPKPQVIEHIVRHSNLGAKEFDLLQQTALKTQYLDEKLTELLAKRKPRGKY